MANKKTSDYAALPGGVPNDSWLLDVANAGVLNYKSTCLEFKDYANDGRTGGKTINGGDATGETLQIRNNSVDDLGFGVLSTGVLRSNISTYETLVLNDDDIPNKKYVDDAISVGAGIVHETLTVTTPGQTSFTLSQTPIFVDRAILTLNGQVRTYGITADYSISGTTLTWNDPGGLTLQTTDDVQIWYDISMAAGKIPSFVAFNNSSITGITGDNTDADIIYDQVDININNHYNPANGVFTAPYDGMYGFSLIVPLENLTNSFDDAEISVYRTGAATANWVMQRLNTQGTRLSTNEGMLSGTVDIKMIAGDTAVFRIKIGNSTKTIDIPLGGICSGKLIERL